MSRYCCVVYVLCGTVPVVRTVRSSVKARTCVLLSLGGGMSRVKVMYRVGARTLNWGTPTEGIKREDF